MSFHDTSSSIPGDGGQIHIQPDGMVRFGSDNQTNVLFYKRPVPDPVLSKQHGRTITRGVDYVRIQHPGERDNIDTPVANKPDALHRWPRQWALYQRSMEQIPEGTPIDQLFPQYPELSANLHGMGVHTIEQMAGMTEHGAQQIGMGATQWRNMARDFLEKANKGVGVHRMQAELEKRDNEIEVLRNQLAEQKTMIDRLLAAQQGVPGAMIPSGPLPSAQAHAASLRAVAPAPVADWTQLGGGEIGEVSEELPPAGTEPRGDWTQAISQPSPPHDYSALLVDQQPSNAPPQPAPRRRGRPPKSAATS